MSEPADCPIDATVLRWAFIENCCHALSIGVIIATAGFSGYPQLGWAVLAPITMFNIYKRGKP